MKLYNKCLYTVSEPMLTEFFISQSNEPNVN
jgi:hypothetical protein